MTSLNGSAAAGLIALDYGRKRVGVAVAEPGLSIAFGLTTLIITGLGDLLRQLKPILEEKKPRAIVIGLPLGLEDKPGPVTSEILELAQRLELIGWQIVLVDEALSSRRAGDLLRSRGRRAKKENVDRASAALILQEYLEGFLPPLNKEEILIHPYNQNT